MTADLNVALVLDVGRPRRWGGPYMSVFGELSQFGCNTVTLGYYNLTWLGDRSFSNPIFYTLENYVLPSIRNPKSQGNKIGKLLVAPEANKLSRSFSQHKLDALLTIGYHPAVPKASKKSGVYSILWSIDDPYLHSRDWFEYASEFDLILTYSLGSVMKYRDSGADDVTWFPQCVDTTYYYPPPAEQKQDLLFTFVGSSLTDREPGHRRILYPLINRFGDAVNVYGHGWAQDLGASFHGPVDWRTIPRIYWRSKVVIGIHREPNRTLYCTLNPRIFEALGSQAFLLGDRPVGLEEFFEPGRDLVVVDEADRTVELAEYYLGNDEERRKIAESGFKKVVNAHTAKHRARFLADLIRARIG